MADSKQKNPEQPKAGVDVNKNVQKIEEREVKRDSDSEAANDPNEGEQDENEKEGKEREARMEYASKVSRVTADGGTLPVESERHWEHANRLHADGLAKFHTQQKGMETKTYLILTEDGTRAVQAYNAEKNRD